MNNIVYYYNVNKVASLIMYIFSWWCLKCTFTLSHSLIYYRWPKFFEVFLFFFYFWNFKWLWGNSTILFTKVKMTMQRGSIRKYAYIPLILLQVDCTCTNTRYIGNDYYICIHLLTSAFLRFSKALGIGSWMGRPSFTSLMTVNGIDGTASGFNRA